MAPNGFLDDARQIAPPRTLRIDFDDGSFALRSPVALQPYARCVGEWLERWAGETPDAIALAERDDDGGGWRRLDYRALRQAVGAVAQSLLDLGVPKAAAGGDPVRQRDRPRGADAGRDARRPHRLLAVERLLAHGEGPGAAARHAVHARPGAGLCLGRQAVRRRARRPGGSRRRGSSAAMPRSMPGALPFERLLQAARDARP